MPEPKSKPEGMAPRGGKHVCAYDDKMKLVPQDDQFLDKEPWDFRNTPGDHYPLLLFYHPLNIYRKQVIKQADVVLAMFLLGDAFSPETKKRNFNFYDALTTGDSSLSSCVEAIIAAQIGDVDKAIRYGMAALLMDLADVGGNVKDGLSYRLPGRHLDDAHLWSRRHAGPRRHVVSGPVARPRTMPSFDFQ